MPVLTVTLGELELRLMASTGVGVEGVSTELRRVLEQDLRTAGTWRGPLPAVDGQKSKVSVRLADGLRGDLERRRGSAELGAYVRGVLRAAYGADQDTAAPRPQRATSRGMGPGNSPPPLPPPVRALPVPPEIARLPFPRRVAALVVGGCHAGADLEQDGLRVRIGSPMTAHEVDARFDAPGRRLTLHLLGPSTLDRILDVQAGDRRAYMLGLDEGMDGRVRVFDVRIDDLVEGLVEFLVEEARLGDRHYVADLRLAPFAGFWVLDVLLQVRAGRPAMRSR